MTRANPEVVLTCLERGNAVRFFGCFGVFSSVFRGFWLSSPSPKGTFGNNFGERTFVFLAHGRLVAVGAVFASVLICWNEFSRKLPEKNPPFVRSCFFGVFFSILLSSSWGWPGPFFLLFLWPACRRSPPTTGKSFAPEHASFLSPFFSARAGPLSLCLLFVLFLSLFSFSCTQGVQVEASEQ